MQAGADKGIPARGATAANRPPQDRPTPVCAFALLSEAPVQEGLQARAELECVWLGGEAGAVPAAVLQRTFQRSLRGAALGGVQRRCSIPRQPALSVPAVKAANTGFQRVHKGQDGGGNSRVRRI